MARGQGAQLEASGRRFQMRRLIHALVRGDTAMVDEPIRAQSISYASGWLAGLLAVAVCAVIAIASPAGGLGEAPIVMVRDTGALYVRIGSTWHPALNLASARLVAKSAVNPVPVNADAIAAAPRGPLVGIPGAPAELGRPLTATAWQICDSGRTVLLAGQVAGGHERTRPILATAAGEHHATTYLVYDGRRAEVDLRDLAVVRALRLDGVSPRSLSRSFLDLLPEVPAIAAPGIAGLGTKGPGGFLVGQVLRVNRADAAEHHVVLAGGLQRVGDVAADVIRFAHGVADGDLRTVRPADIAAIPAVHDLTVSSFPEQALAPLPSEVPVCAQWQSASGRADTAVVPGKPAAHEVALVQADGDGPNIDAVAIPPGRYAYVHATGVTGGSVTGPLYLVADTGVRYGIHDADTAKYLGVEGEPLPAPWPLLARLPGGPELSVPAAEVLRDGLAP
ncbi:type VII secretion protein EccB [Mycolicibacterium llatzerense]|uniref:type VII secretion protein EccB n=1 Tax=Mycolicibacterium llatzerense TaxID=280871 RepID=UPI0021B699DA|nr:type VII secretion protein EccB [Mycolicibacterium llatzerense]MCT7363691.1 type VII secretion protein EccB [Mycolicibacterium llatzerense]MCT7367847.1 type VII secretion protein EccB [Mycolicibacterium llatzerense]